MTAEEGPDTESDDDTWDEEEEDDDDDEEEEEDEYQVDVLLYTSTWHRGRGG